MNEQETEKFAKRAIDHAEFMKIDFKEANVLDKYIVVNLDNVLFAHVTLLLKLGHIKLTGS